MAFETIRGEAGVDFIGTDGVDSVFILNESGAITADGQEGDDIIIISDSDNVVGTATIRGGAGADTITLSDQDGANNNSRLIGSSVNGGAGNDDITLVGAATTAVRGNENDDDFTLSGNYTSVTVNGNSGTDSFAQPLIGADLSLSNAKILGGNDNDGAMNIGDIASAVDSTINGSKGNDGITIGDVTTATNFTVFGGQGDDLITSTNTGSDSVIYSGDLGDDTIDTTAATADTSILGGDGDDNLSAGTGEDTIEGGANDDTIDGGANDDVLNGGAGADDITGDTGDDTITGGAGADSYTVGAGADEYVITAISDSAATTAANDTVTFDTFNRFRNGDVIDITAVAQSLTGDRVTGAAVAVINAGAAIATADDFSEIADAVAGTLTASTTDIVEVTTFTVTAGDLAGDYFVVNDRNTNLSAADLMFQVTAGGSGNVTAASFAVV